MVFPKTLLLFTRFATFPREAPLPPRYRSLIAYWLVLSSYRVTMRMGLSTKIIATVSDRVENVNRKSTRIHVSDAMDMVYVNINPCALTYDTDIRLRLYREQLRQSLRLDPISLA